MAPSPETSTAALTNAPLEEALSTMLAAAPAMGEEWSLLRDAGGRVLAGDVAARRDLPPFRASAMDGWAARIADLDERPLRIVGESAAGRGYGHPIGAGEAVRIFTGAPVPDGADIVVLQEEARRAGETVLLMPQTLQKHNIRPAAGDMAAGEIVLPAGRRLDAAALSLAAAAGQASLKVAMRPRVGVLCTGSELVAPGDFAEADQIFESNSPALVALAGAWGGLARRLTPQDDQIGAIASAVQSALLSLDVVVVVGGASVGDHDLAKPALDSLGMTLHVNKARVRPGKPVWFGRLGDAAVLGLPGNPASAFVCAHLFLRPLLETMLGAPVTPLAGLTARLVGPLRAEGPRESYLRARILADPAGGLWADASANQDSSLVGVLAGANGCVRRLADSPPAAAGERVSVGLFEGRSLILGDSQ